MRRGGPLPRAVERAVRLRDRNACRVPGCRRRRYVDVHHIAPRGQGGQHSRSNCVCLCTTHHALLHDGRLRIEGDAEGELRFHDETGAPLSLAVTSHVGTATVPVASDPGTAGMPVASHVGTAAAVAVTSHVGTATVPVASHVGTAAAVPVASHVGTSTAAVAGAGDEAAALLALMGRRGGWSVDALVEASGLFVGAVQHALLGLELDGRVECDPFGSYAPCTTP